MLSIQQAYLDRTIDLKNQLKEAVVQEHQDVIDEKNELKDALQDAADKTINGLRDSLEKDRKLYESDKDEKELTILQMQLAAAQNSGGALSKIRDLQQKISDKQKDMYFTERENQIQDLEDIANK